VSGKDELSILSQKFNNLTQEIKQLLKQKDRLLSEVSHEFRTPLAKIRLLLAMIRQKSQIKKESDLVEEKIIKIDQHVDYLDSIIKNVLISDKLDMPYTNLDIEEVKISQLIKQAIELSKNKDISVNSLDEEMVRCDVVKISIVIRNLLDNAGKYGVSKKPVEITASSEKDIVCIVVRDYGPGIDKELLSTITQPYIRGKNTKQPGFGLGLSICKKVMESHGGTMTIKNMPDKGCSFMISWNSQSLKGRETRHANL
jgi:signal transduction histidine kinase